MWGPANLVSNRSAFYLLVTLPAGTCCVSVASVCLSLVAQEQHDLAFLLLSADASKIMTENLNVNICQ